MLVIPDHASFPMMNAAILSGNLSHVFHPYPVFRLPNWPGMLCFPGYWNELNYVTYLLIVIDDIEIYDGLGYYLDTMDAYRGVYISFGRTKS